MMNSASNQGLFTELVATRIKKMLGEEKGTQVLAELFLKLGKNNVETPEELKRVADELIGRGGLTKMIGHSLMTEALLRGARP